MAVIRFGLSLMRTNHLENGLPSMDENLGELSALLEEVSKDLIAYTKTRILFLSIVVLQTHYQKIDSKKK